MRTPRQTAELLVKETINVTLTYPDDVPKTVAALTDLMLEFAATAIETGLTAGELRAQKAAR